MPTRDLIQTLTAAAAVASLRNEARRPAVYFTNEFLDLWGLMTYRSSAAESYRRGATHVDKILN